MNIVGTKKKKGSLKRKPGPKDPLANAMEEMMNRIKTGNMQLRPVRGISTDGNKGDNADAMSDLGNFLKSLKKNPNVENGGPNSPPPSDEQEVAWANIKLRKCSAIEPSRTLDEVNEGENNNELKMVTLRKPRSRSTGDVLDERSGGEATSELKKILMKQKAAAEKEENDGTVDQDKAR